MDIPPLKYYLTLLPLSNINRILFLKIKPIKPDLSSGNTEVDLETTFDSNVVLIKKPNSILLQFLKFGLQLFNQNQKLT